MKVKEFMKMYNLKTEEELRLYFLDNLRSGKVPVAMYSCPKCEEILGDASDMEVHICSDNDRSTDDDIREKLIDIILKVAMRHHDDISKADEDAACDAADEILTKFLDQFLDKIKSLEGITYEK